MLNGICSHLDIVIHLFLHTEFIILEILLFSMVRISWIFVVVHVMHLQVSVQSQSCAADIERSARSGRDECLRRRSNAPECIRGYDVAIGSIPRLCSSSGSGRKKRSKYGKSYTTQICMSSSFLSIPIARVFILHIFNAPSASLKYTSID